MTLTLGLSVTADEVTAAVVDAAGAIQEGSRRAAHAASPDELAVAAAALVTDLRRAHDVVGLGIGVLYPSITAPGGSGPEGSLPLNLQRLTDLPTVVEPAGRCMAWAECRFGAARGTSNSVFVGVADGIDGGMVLDGALQHGSGGRSAQFGHMRVAPEGRRCPCGNRGCWQQYAGGRALVLGVLEYATTEDLGTVDELLIRDDQARAGSAAEDVLAAARAGNRVANSVRDGVARWLGSGLAGLTSILDPDVLVLGGLITREGADLLAPTTAAFLASLPAAGMRPIAAIRQAELGDDATVLGAADLVRS